MMEHTNSYTLKRAIEHSHDLIPHLSRDVVFILMIHGSRTYRIDGKDIVIHPENGLFVNRDVLMLSYPSNCDFICLTFQPEQMCQDASLFSSFIEPMLKKPSYLLLNKDVPWQNDILNQILQLYMFQSAHAQDLDLIVHQSFYLLFHLLYTSIPLVDEHERESNKISQFRRMITFIETNYDQQIRLSDIAQSANISNSGASALFKEMINDSPYHYLLTFRMEKARTLLYQNDISVTDAALQSGFTDTSHFTKIFRQTYGITPASYRRQSRQ